MCFGSNKITGIVLYLDELIDKTCCPFVLFAPNNRTSFIRYFLSISINIFTVAFHILVGNTPNLCIYYQVKWILFHFIKIIIPNTDKCKNYWNVFSNEVVEKCNHTKTAKNSSKFSYPIVHAIGKPIADHKEYRPPTQSQNSTYF